MADDDDDDDEDVANEANKSDEKDLKIEASKVICWRHFWVWKSKSKCLLDLTSWGLYSHREPCHVLRIYFDQEIHWLLFV